MYSITVSHHFMMARQPSRRGVWSGAEATRGDLCGRSRAASRFARRRWDRLRHRPRLDLLKAVLGEFEYRNLDELEEFRGRNTTTEFLAGEIHRRLARRIKEGALGPQLIASLKVVLRENPVAWASYDAALE